ncbi:asparagine synthetase [glutamine-hydrolyzing] 2 [Cyclospora cayetanensis]|uniref:Asparagine synthetase [glutamine-hydrolyzing] 2 n=2 Tax=Cyclospora cayetanensis TaxID=88456 RepID=A0A6P5WC59_9EIME|nr:asparagine synthetase [glutamine-hydrolyzing] 2 [Cyclospora cayetanensis]OEH74016.1 putative asparagine synthase [Cyclospora cayetanensis]
MCGVTAILLSPLEQSALRQLCLSRSKLIRHRGPDWNGIEVINYGGNRIHALAHERLSIVDPTSGKQPLNDPDRVVVCTANGEIYNHMQLRKQLDPREAQKLETLSDCQVIPSLFKQFGRCFVSMLDGDFAIVVVDRRNGDFLVARDPIGISPLYVGHAANGSIWFSSEVKSLQQDCVRVREFPPGHSFFFKASKSSGIMERYFQPAWMQPDACIPQTSCDLSLLRAELEKAVSKRMMCDVPFGILLYGGIDSAIIASIVCRLYNDRFKNEQNDHFWTPKIHSFAIGVKGCMDLECSRMVAKHVGSTHHEFTFELQEAIDALSDLIYMIESYDVLTVRAALLNYFLYRLIKSIGVKMVITGEGAADLFGCAGDMQEERDPVVLHRAIVRRMADMHFTDSLRANKASMCWGVEARVPYLDVNFVEYAMSINPGEKLCGQGRLPKQLLRDAYKDELPQAIIDRIRVDNQFGVSYQWTDALKKHAEDKVTDLMLSNADILFPYNPPKSKEAYLYRSIFSGHFPDQSVAKIVPGGHGDSKDGLISPATKVLNGL